MKPTVMLIGPGHLDGVVLERPARAAIARRTGRGGNPIHRGRRCAG